MLVCVTTKLMQGTGPSDFRYSAPSNTYLRHQTPMMIIKNIGVVANA